MGKMKQRHIKERKKTFNPSAIISKKLEIFNKIMAGVFHPVEIKDFTEQIIRLAENSETVIQASFQPLAMVYTIILNGDECLEDFMNKKFPSETGNLNKLEDFKPIRKEIKEMQDIIEETNYYKKFYLYAKCFAIWADKGFREK